MVIHLTSAKGTTTVSNRFPSEANANRVISYVVFTVVLGIMTFIAVAVFASNRGGGAAALMVPVLGGVFVLGFGFMNSHGGPRTDVEIDQKQNLIIVGEKKMQLTGATFVYHSQTYNNPATKEINDGEIMVVGIQSGAESHRFKMRIDDFTHLKDVLKDELGISMQKGWM